MLYINIVIFVPILLYTHRLIEVLPLTNIVSYLHICRLESQTSDAYTEKFKYML